MLESNGHIFKDLKENIVFILFDMASSYWMVAYNYEILDRNFHSYNEAKNYVIEHGCKEWEG